MPKRSEPQSRILAILGREQKPVSISGLSRKTGLDRHVVAHQLEILSLTGTVAYIHQGKAKKYYIVGNQPPGNLIATSPECIIMIDAGLNVLYTNDTTIAPADRDAQKTGRMRLDALSHPVVHHPDFLAALQEGRNRRIFNTTLVTRKGEGQISYLVTITPTSIPVIGPGFLVIIEPITKGKELRTPLGKEVAEHLSSGIVIADLTGGILYANPTLLVSSGHRDIFELLGKNIVDIFALDPDYLRALLDDDVRPPFFRESRTVRSDGSRVIYLMHWEVVRSPDHLPLYLFGFLLNLSARQMLQERIETLNARFQHLVESIPDIIWETGPDLRYTYVSPAITAVTGFLPQELLGMEPPWLSDPLSGKETRTLFDAASHTVSPLIIRAHSLHHRNGDTVPVETRAVSVFSPAGEFLGFSGIDRDITLQKEAEEELRQTNEAPSRKEKMLANLNEIISTANRADDLPSLLNKTLYEILTIMDYDAGGIYLTDHEAGTATVVASINIPEDFLAGVRTVPIWQAPYDDLLVRGIPLITEHYDQLSPERAEMIGALSIASVPIISGDTTIGSINTISRRRHVVTKDEKDLLISIGNEIGATIVKMAAEEKVKKIAANLELLFNSIDEMVFILRMDGTILRVNETVVKKLGYSEEELTGRDVLFLHVPERRDEALRIVQGMIAGTIDSCPVPVLTKDGTRIEVETKVTPGVWDGREVLIGVTRDVTEKKQAEDALRKGEERLRILYETMAEGVVLIAPDGQIVQANPAAERILGLTRSEIEGRNYSGSAWGIIRPDGTPMPPEEMAGPQAMTEKRIINDVIMGVNRPDSSTSWIRVTAAPILNDAGGIEWIVGTFIDITMHKLAEEARAESEAKFRSLAESSGDYIMRYDRECRHLYMNPAALRVSGLEEESIIMKTHREAGFDEKLCDLWEEKIRYVFETGEGVSALFAWKSPEGEVYLDWKLSPEFAADRSIRSVLGVSRDITDQTPPETALLESETRYRHMFESMEDVYYQTDTNGIITVISPSLYRISGWKPEELIGKLVTEVYVHPQDRADLLEAITKQGYVRDYELLLKRRDGTPIPVSVSANRIRNADGSPAGLAGILRDISTRRQKDDALQRANRQLNQLMRITRDDIRSQLLVLKGSLARSHLMLEDPARMSEIIASEEKLVESIQRVIAFMREFEDLGTRPPEWQNVEGCIRAARKRLDLTGIGLNTRDLETIEIFADPHLIHVFHDLLDHSLRHGGGVMTGIACSSRQECDRLVITFEDDGCGIPAGDKEKIFGWGSGEKSGYGLFFTREVLGITGITITETGVEGKGARFEISVPNGVWRAAVERG